MQFFLSVSCFRAKLTTEFDHYENSQSDFDNNAAEIQYISE